MEVSPQTQQSYLKLYYWKVDRAVQSRDQKIQKLQKVVTIKKGKHVVSKLILVAKVKIEKKLLR